jgi:hypothetical protein
MRMVPPALWEIMRAHQGETMGRERAGSASPPIGPLDGAGPGPMSQYHAKHATPIAITAQAPSAYGSSPACSEHHLRVR